ncbi:MAG: hypothetical protein EAZ87_16895 [Nostocales cyanobacterium]|nr:MAG: hypothetical protein EAZ87_16895 [Nostocales cyanobacterium]
MCQLLLPDFCEVVNYKENLMRSLNLRQVKFTNKADQINSDYGITIPKHYQINTRNGADKIIGKKEISDDFGIELSVEIVETDHVPTIFNREFIITKEVNTDGIKNKGIINTGNGADKITGVAKTDLSANAIIIFQALALAKTTDTAVISNLFTSVELNATTDGIDNSYSHINTGNGKDYISGFADASITAVAIANADISAIVDDITQTPNSENLTAFAQAITVSIAQAKIIAKGINNTKGRISTGNDDDTICGKATSVNSTFSETFAGTFVTATPNSQAVAEAVANAVAETEDMAIAIDNQKGLINTGNGNDHIIAIAEARNKAIAINNTHGLINTGNGNDTIIANATSNESYSIFGGHINMGNGNDQLKASNFGGGVNINMGNGDDFVVGFGEATLNGGSGFDILNVGTYNIEDFQINLGTNNNQVTFELNNIIMNTIGFEQFDFANGSFNINF